MKRAAPVKKPAQPQPQPQPKLARGQVQGEGDYKAARRHRAGLEKFVASGQVDAAARGAEPKTPVEELEMFEAERSGEARSKGEDGGRR